MQIHLIVYTCSYIQENDASGVVWAKIGCKHEQPIYSNREGTFQNRYDVKMLYSNYYIVCLGF